VPNFIKIDPYSFELYRFKVGAFFETQCSYRSRRRLNDSSRSQRTFVKLTNE